MKHQQSGQTPSRAIFRRRFVAPGTEPTSIFLTTQKGIASMHAINPLRRILIVLLSAVAVLASVTTVSASATIGGLDDLAYTEGDGWKNLDSAVTVSGDNNWSNGYVEIALSGGNTYDQLRLNSSGSLSVSGTAVMWNGNRIGTIE